MDSATHTAKVIVNGYQKPITDDLLATVTAQYTNEKNLVYNHSFEVQKATFTTVQLEIKLVVTDEIPDSVITQILTNYFNGGIITANNQQWKTKGCSVNSSITNYELMTLLEQIQGVIQVTEITSGSASFNKLTPSTNKVLKLGNVNITQNVVE